MLGFYSYSSSFLGLSLQSVVLHHKISDKKQGSDSVDGISVDINTSSSHTNLPHFSQYRKPQVEQMIDAFFPTK